MPHSNMHRLAITLIAAAIAVVAAYPCNGGNRIKKSGAPVKMIIETDMGNDIDDALALAIALKAMDEGKIQLLAVGCHKKSQTAARFVDVVNTYYGHPEVEVCESLTPVVDVFGSSDYTNRPVTLGLKESRNGKFSDPVKVYRKILSEAKDHSINFASFGFGTTLAQLLESGPDEYSKLNGVDLVARKAGALCIMGGSYGDKKRAEFNVICDIPSMQKVFEMWPGVIYQNPFEIGKMVMYPAKNIEANLGWGGVNPVVEAYKDYKKMPYDRPCWDLMSVVWFLRPDLFTVSEPGRVTVDEKGYTHYEAKRDGRHYVLSATIDQPRDLLDYVCRMTTK